MPVMKQLRIGSATYDTVGEASVTQVQTSGTKIATVTIDGTATDLYAPEGGGSGPEPSSTTPAMDGTAAVGTATTYARADHVHPTDTSRQAALVSGTNIKTVNGNSLLGSGNLSIRQLPDPAPYANGSVLYVYNGSWVVGQLPRATDSEYGVVKVDGTTITSASGVISVASSIQSYEVTVSLTNPVNGSAFQSCQIWQMASSSPTDLDNVLLATITSPTGSSTVELPETAYGLNLLFYGTSPYVDLDNFSCTGGVSAPQYDGGGGFIFVITADGTIVADGIDYDD